MKTLKMLIIEADKVFEAVMSDYFQNDKNKVEFNYKDAVVLGLLENLINHAKSIILLLERNHHSSLDSILRTVFENFVYLKFIFQKDTDRRSRSYALSTKINEIGLLEKLTDNSMDGYKMRQFIGIDKDTITKHFKKGIDEEYKANTINGYLKEIGMQRKEQKWYNLDGKTKTFKDLCTKMDMSVEYELLYSTLSLETHAKDAIRNFLFAENRVDLINVMKNKELYVSLSSLYLMNSIKLIYAHYGLNRRIKKFNNKIAVKYQFK